jgi:hypothetical protein
MTIYKNQSLVKITLETGQDLTGATNTKILYKKPDSTKGEWAATIVGTTLEYLVQNGNIDQDGNWELQSCIEIAGRKGYGQKVKLKVEPQF